MKNLNVVHENDLLIYKNSHISTSVIDKFIPFYVEHYYLQNIYFDFSLMYVPYLVKC